MLRAHSVVSNVELVRKVSPDQLGGDYCLPNPSDEYGSIEEKRDKKLEQIAIKKKA